MSKKVSLAAVLGLIEAAIADNYMSPVAKLYRLRCEVHDLPTTNESICSDADTTSRQAAIDAIRDARHRFTVADEAGGLGTVKWSEDVIYFAAAERVLSGLPSAQPEIIRCKDCKQKYLDNMIWNCPFGLPGGEDFFCAYGAKGGDKE